MMGTVVESALVKEAIGKNIRERRISVNLSLDDLAEKMKTSPGYVALVERGRRSFTVLQMITLAEIFDVSIDELVQTDNSESWPLITRIIAYLRQMNGTDIEQVISLCERASKEKSCTQA